MSLNLIKRSKAKNLTEEKKEEFLRIAEVYKDFAAAAKDKAEIACARIVEMREKYGFEEMEVRL